MGLSKERKLEISQLKIRNGQNHHSNHRLWLDVLPKGKQSEGELFLVNVGQNIELAKGAHIRGRTGEGVGLLRSTLRKIERFFGTPVNVVYCDTLQVLSGLLESTTVDSEGHKSQEDELEREWLQASSRLTEIQQELAKA